MHLGAFGGVDDRFHDLMPHRVHEILLVATRYDSFILEADGRFADRLYDEYAELSLTSPPRLTRASNGREACALLRERRFDLVLTVSRMADMAPAAFARLVKAEQPDMPVAMLAYDERAALRAKTTSAGGPFDAVVVWNGDSRLLLALVKVVEDRANVHPDTRNDVIRVLLVASASPVDYSAQVSDLYRAVMRQTRLLMADGLNRLDRLYRMRTRPKILVARSFEDALGLAAEYRDSLLGIVADFALLREGRLDPRAGLELVRAVRTSHVEVPALLHSRRSEDRHDAESSGASFAERSPDLLHDHVEEFIRTQCGFGDFVFRLPSGEAVDRAANMADMQRALERVRPESLRFHTERNHISSWLMARSEFALALEVRPRKTTEFDDIEEIRRYLVDAFARFADEKQRGQITEVSRVGPSWARDFVRIGGGSLGGKGRGVAFLNSLIARHGLGSSYPDVRVFVPQTAVVCTDEFDRFLWDNELHDRIAAATSDREIVETFLHGRLSSEVQADLETMLRSLEYPLAVRSSSLLEDSQMRPFAGVYATYMLPNNAPRLRTRLRQLRQAIKLVFASTFLSGARSYMRAIGRTPADEKMAVIIQRLVGTLHGARFYPTFSGVAQSHNFYPIRHIKPEDGIATVALGLGRTVVAGGKALRFSPGHPRILPQMSTPEDALRSSQTEFFALDMSRPGLQLEADEAGTLVKPELDVAEADGVLAHVGATFSAEAHRIYDTIYRDGMRIVNFAPILKYGRFPLAPILTDLLQVAREAMGGACEIELAVNLDMPPGRRREFGVVQIRPLLTGEQDAPVDLADFDPADAVVSSNRTLGNGVFTDISDVVFIPPERWDPLRTVLMAEEVAAVNADLQARHRPYVLIGPGRWGTSEQALGVPVTWMQVSAARVIVEAAIEGFEVDPSQGNHFFHNITSLKVGYLTVDPRQPDELLDWAWLRAQPVVADHTYVRHLRLPAPLDVRLSGIKGIGLVLRPRGG